MDDVQTQYEAYPYPARDPKDEAARLIVGSPSHPVEIDHFIFGGARDWSAPFQALIAGGGSGDALVMLAQLLKNRGAPAEIHYLDLSSASRKIAEARISARGLDNVVFHTADLLTAPELGRFDYIDCCGVLHHLPDPDAGFAALAAALKADGGLGGMVYAPYGRTGVYPLQDAFGRLFAPLAPADKLSSARRLFERLPQTHPFLRNALVNDHLDGDAGFYDLLLHARDRPYTAIELIAALERAGCALSGFLEPARYELDLYLGPELMKTAAIVAGALSYGERATLAEQIAGNMKTHIFYAGRAAAGLCPPQTMRPDLIPVIHKAPAGALADTLSKSGKLRFVVDGLTVERAFDRRLAPLIRAIDGRRTLGDLQQAAKLDWFGFAQKLGPLLTALSGFNLMRYSRFYA